jgi:hypothetical protein
MLALLRQLLSDPLSYVVIVALVWFLKRYIEHLVAGRVNTEFAKQLENHKHQLALAADAARFDYQRRLSEFNLYAARKHQIAAEVYEKFRIAHGRIRGLTGLSTQLTFEEYNVADITEYMSGRGVPKGKQDEVVALWSVDRSHAIGILRPYLRMLTIQEAERSFAEAKNCAYSNELYVSDTVIAKMNDLIGQLSEHLAAVEYPPEPGEKRPSKPELDKALEVLRDTLHAQLAGHTSGTNELAPGHNEAR